MVRPLRARRPYKRNGLYMDAVNCILAAAICILGVLNLVEPVKNAKLFPVMFLLGTVMNGIMCAKYILRKDRARSIALAIGCVICLGISIFTFLALW